MSECGSHPPGEHRSGETDLNCEESRPGLEERVRQMLAAETR